MAAMTISALARAGEVGVETVRYYQRRGLLPTPEKSGGSGLAGGIRRYGPEHVRKLRFIRAAQASGFTLDQIGELLTLEASQNRARARALAAEHIAALDARIAALQAARSALEHLAHQCAAADEGPCPILASFDRAG